MVLDGSVLREVSKLGVESDPSSIIWGRSSSYNSLEEDNDAEEMTGIYSETRWMNSERDVLAFVQEEGIQSLICMLRSNVDAVKIRAIVAIGHMALDDAQNVELVSLGAMQPLSYLFDTGIVERERLFHFNENMFSQ